MCRSPMTRTRTILTSRLDYVFLYTSQTLVYGFGFEFHCEASTVSRACRWTG